MLNLPIDIYRLLHIVLDLIKVGPIVAEKLVVLYNNNILMFGILYLFFFLNTLSYYIK